MKRTTNNCPECRLGIPHPTDLHDTRPLHVIAREIRRTWKNVSPYADPYVRAMTFMYSINDSYGLDPASDIVARFLCNAKGWRGEDARRIKNELTTLLKGAK